MRKNVIFFTSLTCAIVASWLIINLISHFSPIQLTPENYTYIVSPPTADAVGASAKVAKASIDYVGFITILLGLISALLAALGLGIAVLAVIGWNSISGKVESTANEFIRASVTDGDIKALIQNGLRKGGPLYDAVVTETRNAMYRGVENVGLAEDFNRDVANDS